jgi:hypothetical protein
MALTNDEVDAILRTTIPGGSTADAWFLPHENAKGLENVRDVVRRMVATAEKLKASRVDLSDVIHNPREYLVDGKPLEKAAMYLQVYGYGYEVHVHQYDHGLQEQRITRIPK